MAPPASGFPTSTSRRTLLERGFFGTLLARRPPLR